MTTDYRMSEVPKSGTEVQASVPLVELAGISKNYGHVVACDDVSIALHSGEIHGILGENGAGKSTLMKILIGLVKPDNGTISMNGVVQQVDDPQAASRIGFGMVHQHFSLVEELTVWENVLLGEELKFNRARARKLVGEIGERFGLIVNPDSHIRDLSAGMRQRVELIKCLRRDPKLVILDEPTSVLTPAESEQFFPTLREKVAIEGRAVVLVSHKLSEVIRATDVITIMRHGRVVDHKPTKDTDAVSLARAMVGREVSLRTEGAALGVTVGQHQISHRLTGTPTLKTKPMRDVLEISEVDVSVGGVLKLHNLTLRVREGEVLGIAGVEGNGQRELGDILSSLLQVDCGSVKVNGNPVSTSKHGAMARSGIAVIPEDRHDSGVVLGMTVAQNLAMQRMSEFTRFGVIDDAALIANAESLIDEFEIRCDGPRAPLHSLSGGNQQRVVLARELSSKPKVLVAAQPTRGLDVGAIEYMSGRMEAAASTGIAVLLISTDLDEILHLSHRIAVISSGEIVGTLLREEATMEKIGLLLGGMAI